MKKRITKLLLVSAMAALGLTLTAGAQPLFSFTFDTGTQGFNGGAWSSTLQALQQNKTAGGWTLGSSIMHEFDWASGQQAPMQALAASGNGRVSLDLFVNGSSFAAGQAYWYNIWMAGNSDGSAGWTQQKPVDTWHNADDAALYTTHVDLAFADLGWAAGDSWFQLYLGSNSDAGADRVVNFYADNIIIYSVPEPATMALACLGATAVLILRRRR